MAGKDDKPTSTLDFAPTPEAAPRPMGANGKGRGVSTHSTATSLLT